MASPAPAPLRCLVVDDEPPARDELAYILSTIEGVEVVALASTANAALEVIAREPVDLVFLDIQMPGQDGFHVTSRLAAMESPPLVVMATAHDQHAVRAFEECAMDYILKPFSEDRVFRSVERARALRNALPADHAQAPASQLRRLAAILDMATAQGAVRVPVEHGGRLLLLRPEELVLCRAHKKRVIVHTHSEQFTAQAGCTLDNLQERLRDPMGRHLFFRPHRGHLINLAHVREISPWENGRYVLVMDDAEHTEVVASRANARELKALLGL